MRLQASFGWHQDTEERRKQQKLTIVYMLSSGRSTMCVAGAAEFVYSCGGAGGIFASDAWHRSGEAPPSTLNIAFFFG